MNKVLSTIMLTLLFSSFAFCSSKRDEDDSYRKKYESDDLPPSEIDDRNEPKDNDKDASKEDSSYNDTAKPNCIGLFKYSSPNGKIEKNDCGSAEITRDEEGKRVFVLLMQESVILVQIGEFKAGDLLLSFGDEGNVQFSVRINEIDNYKPLFDSITGEPTGEGILALEVEQNSKAKYNFHLFATGKDYQGLNVTLEVTFSGTVSYI